MKRAFHHCIAVGVFCFLIAMSRADFPEAVEQYLENGHIGEYDQLNPLDPHYAEFVAYVREHWREILNTPEKLAPLGKPMTVLGRVSAAAQQLPPREYIAYCNRMIDLYTEGKIAAEVVAHPLSPQAQKVNFFEFNWKAPEIQALFRRALQVLPVKEDEKSAYRSILNGELRDSYLFPGNESNPEKLAASPEGSSLRGTNPPAEHHPNAPLPSQPAAPSTVSKESYPSPSSEMTQSRPNGRSKVIWWVVGLLAAIVALAITVRWKCSLDR